MLNFRSWGFNTRHQRPQQGSWNEEEISLLDHGKWDPRKTASLSEVPQALIGAARPDALAGVPRVPACYAPSSTVQSISRYLPKFTSSRRSPGSSEKALQVTHPLPGRSFSARGPFQVPNLSELFLPCPHIRTRPSKPTEVVKQSCPESSAQLVDSKALPASGGPSKSTRIPHSHQPKLSLSIRFSCMSDDNIGEQPSSTFASQPEISKYFSSESNHQLSQSPSRSLSCLRLNTVSSGHESTADDGAEILSAACLLPTLSLGSPSLTCTASLYSKKDITDHDADVSFPDGSSLLSDSRAGFLKSTPSLSSLTATPSFEGFGIPSPRREMQDSPIGCGKTPGWVWPQDHDPGAHLPQPLYPPTYPAGLPPNSQPSILEYHLPPVAHKDEIIQDPYRPDQSRKLRLSHAPQLPSSRQPDKGSASHSPQGRLRCHSSIEPRLSFLSGFRSSESSSSRAFSSSYFTRELHPVHSSETDLTEMSLHFAATTRHADSSPSQHSQLLHSTRREARSTSKPRSFLPLSLESQSEFGSILSASDDRCRPIGSVGVASPLEGQTGTQALTPFQRDMLQIMAVHGESLFKPPVSIPLAVEQPSLLQCEELRARPSPRLPTQETLTDATTPSTPRRSFAPVHHFLTRRDTAPPSDTLGSHPVEFLMANRCLSPETPDGPHPETRFVQSTAPGICSASPNFEAPHEGYARPTLPSVSLRQATGGGKAKSVLCPRPLTAGSMTKPSCLVRRSSQSSRKQQGYEKLVTQPDEKQRLEKQDKFEALLKASDASHGGTIKLSLSSKIDSLVDARGNPMSFAPRLRLPSDLFDSDSPRDSIDFDSHPQLDSSSIAAN